MLKYDATQVIDVYNEVIDRLLNSNTSKVNLETLDRVNLLRSIIVNRLNKADYGLNKPVTIQITHIEPEFKLIVVKVKVGNEELLVGTAHIGIL